MMWLEISNKKAIWKINVSNLEFGNMHRHCRAYQSALLKIYHEQLQTTVLLLAEWIEAVELDEKTELNILISVSIIFCRRNLRLRI